MSARSLPDKKEFVKFEKKTFSENGLLVLGLLGGFALATLALVISNQNTFEPKSLSALTGISWPGGSEITWGEVYLFSLETLLGIVGFWSISTSFIMLLISASPHAEEFRYQNKFAAYSVALLCGGFAGILSLIVWPFSPASGWTILGASMVITVVMVYSRRLDTKKYLYARNMTTPTTRTPTKKIESEDGEKPPNETGEVKAANPKPST